MRRNLVFYYTIKTHKFKAIQEALLQNENDTIINVSKRNDLKDTPRAACPNTPIYVQHFELSYKKNSETFCTMLNKAHK